MIAGKHADPMASCAHYCLHELHIRPADFLKMDMQERAFIMASIEVQIKEEKRRAKKAK